MSAESPQPEPARYEIFVSLLTQHESQIRRFVHTLLPPWMEVDEVMQQSALAEVLTFIRNSFGNSAPTITPQQVAAIRGASGDHQPYTLAELGPYLAVPRDALDHWVFSASDNTKEVKRAIDGDAASRWSTGKPQHEGQWFQFDMGKPFLLTRLSLDATASKNDYPRKYEIRTSDDGEHWSNPVASGAGAMVTTVDFPAKTVTRYLRIVQLGSSPGNFWSIHELAVYAAAADSK